MALNVPLDSNGNVKTTATLVSTTAGTVSPGAAATQSDLVGAVYNSVAPAPTNGQQTALQMDANGNLRTNPYGQIGCVQTMIASATGSQPSVTVPASTKWLLQSVSVALTTNATVANRTMQITLTDGSGNFYLVGEVGSGVQTASLTIRYSFAPGLGLQGSVIANNVLAPFPSVLLGPGHKLATAITGIQAGDSVTLTACVVVLSD